MGKYTSGAANHNRLFVKYLSRHPEVEKISVVRYPVPEKGILLPEKQVSNGIEIYSPKINLKLKNALKTFKKTNLKFKEKLKLAFLKLALKLKGLSTFDSSKYTKAGRLIFISIVILSFERPFPNPFWKTLAKCIKKTEPDIIQSQVEHLSIAGALAREQAKAHFSFQYLLEGASREVEEGTIDYQFPIGLKDALEWLIKSNQVDIFIPISESVRDYLLKFGIDKNKMKIISSPIRLEDFPEIDKKSAREKLGLPLHKKIIVSVGRMAIGKRFQDLVKILKKLPENVMLYIKRSKSIVDELVDTSKNLISLIKKNNLTNRVIINDKDLPYDQMVNIYSAGDVAVFPFLEEPFGMCVAESMACNRPVIVYNSGFLPNFINKNGYIVESLDLEDLYQKTKLLLDDEKLANEMGQRGRELAQQYDINVVGEKLVDLYKKFL